jgi:DNA-directed RNA polymerase specialized sigma subunit
MKGDGLRKCSVECMQNNKNCQEKACRLWIDFPEEKNCSLISIFENGPMTLRQVGDRIGVSFARIKQIETEALRKMRKNSLLIE